MGHGAVPVPGRARRFRQHPSLAAAPVPTEQQLRPLRGRSQGIYQVRGFDLSDISFVRGKTGWIVFDPLGNRGSGSRGVEAVPGACRRRPACLGSDLFPHAWRPLGRRARHRRRGRREVRESPPHRSRRLHGPHGFGKRLCRQRHEPAAVLSVRPAAARQSAWLCRSGSRPGRVGWRHGADRAEPLRRGTHRGLRGRWCGMVFQNTPNTEHLGR